MKIVETDSHPEYPWNNSLGSGELISQPKFSQTCAVLDAGREAQFWLRDGKPAATFPSQNGIAPASIASSAGMHSAIVARRRRRIHAIAGSAIISVCSEIQRPKPTLAPNAKRCHSAP